MYLSAEKIAAMEGEHRVHFVNPAAKRINKSLGDAAGLKNLGVHMMTVAPGDRSSEYHCHRYEDEAIYVIIRARDGGDRRRILTRSDREISWVSPVAARRTRHSTTATNRWSAWSSDNGLRKTSSTIRVPANGCTATAASAIWWTIRIFQKR